VPQIAVARVARAHGVRGELRLKLYNPESSAIQAGVELRLRRGDGEVRTAVVSKARVVKDGLLVALEGLGDRDSAEALRGAEVSVDSDALPALDEGEFYAYQLVGCEVLEAESGAARGRVTGLIDNAAHPLLQVELQGARWLLPFVDAYVREVDAAGRRLLVGDVAELVALASG
jgi:16S rRNA processing protein RimM